MAGIVVPWARGPQRKAVSCLPVEGPHLLALSASFRRETGEDLWRVNRMSADREDAPVSSERTLCRRLGSDLSHGCPDVHTMQFAC
jgi:hypothetical protein